MPSRRLLLIGGTAALLYRSAPAQADSRLEGHLGALMAQHHAPAASVALIRDGAIVEHMAIGADPQTLFQAASISKVVTGVVILRLVDRREIDLDRPVNEALRSGKLPGPDAQSVTARQLLSRAGTNVPGFPGYAVGANLPTLLQILDGSAPANTVPARVQWKPGRAFRYSGGGTMVLQQLVMDATRQMFLGVSGDLVLKPAGMSCSSFAQPPPRSETNAVVAHDSEGRPLPGGGHVYPELAAAGPWSTASDLAHLALAVSASWRQGGLISRPMARSMAQRVDDGPTGLGIFVHPQSGRPPLLYHDGVNAGFRSVLAFLRRRQLRSGIDDQW